MADRTVFAEKRPVKNRSVGVYHLKAIEKWLRMVDKPLATKEGDKKDAEPRKE